MIIGLSENQAIPRPHKGFQAVEGVGAAEGVAEGDVGLPLAGVPFIHSIAGVVLAVELPEKDCK